MKEPARDAIEQLQPEKGFVVLRSSRSHAHGHCQHARCQGRAMPSAPHHVTTAALERLIAATKTSQCLVLRVLHSLGTQRTDSLLATQSKRMLLALRLQREAVEAAIAAARSHDRIARVRAAHVLQHVTRAAATFVLSR